MYASCRSTTMKLVGCNSTLNGSERGNEPIARRISGGPGGQDDTVRCASRADAAPAFFNACGKVDGEPLEYVKFLSMRRPCMRMLSRWSSETDVKIAARRGMSDCLNRSTASDQGNTSSNGSTSSSSKNTGIHPCANAVKYRSLSPSSQPGGDPQK